MKERNSQYIIAGARRVPPSRNGSTVLAFVNLHKGLIRIDYFSLNGLARVLIIVLTILLALLCIVLCFVFFFPDVSITPSPCRIETGKL